MSARRVIERAAAALSLVAVIAGCGSSATSGASHPGGSVNVLYAGSLQTVMNSRIAPVFQRATGITFNGYPAGSKDLASEIKGKVRVGDVFISASPTVNVMLAGAANGNWVSWYAPFGRTTLVLGYNRHSSFAHDLATQPWYRVITRPGFRLGFTDPKLDPKGVLAVSVLDQAAAKYHAPALRQIATAQADLFPEQDLVGRLQAGQLDAGFFYTVEATAANIPTVSLAPINESATYTVTVLNRAPNAAAAVAFVRFLLGPRGRPLLSRAGVQLLTPRASGSGVPGSLRRVIH